MPLLGPPTAQRTSGPNPRLVRVPCWHTDLANLSTPSPHPPSSTLTHYIITLCALQTSRFGPASVFWRDHTYNPDGTTPYFSYIHPLPAAGEQYVEPSSTLDVVRECVMCVL